ncbi:hypothetical protein [Candidatus Igneacidithiobacillus taiwanensis]|uniref:hypothetical protein n=1 Tax=Candidatus Igneacidithiobacillus taiwanensis TaxID=1945924 RepID=UPI00289DD01E|nr:hypothetical protein [Candidatus Igneacidithiobacillus taiwanensis]
MFTPEAWSFLEQMAARYIWWKTPEEALCYPDRLIAQVMDIGTLEDILGLERLMGKGRLADVLRHAEAGWFRPQSWAYWHYRLGLTKFDEEPPPEPQREIG